ncbi:MAG: transglutaminase domain-containing protein [Ruminococcaceae bacterium]|nr:transglutaminase domain-containing protein [Oscillospiraceae bacterium]
MRIKRIAPLLWTFIYSAALSVSSVYCLTSSFGYPAENELMYAALMAAALFTLLTLIPKPGISLVLSLLVFCVLLYAPVGKAFVGGMFRMFGIILKSISEFYPILTLPCQYCTLHGYGSCEVFLFFLSAAQSLLLCRCITAGKFIWPALLPPFAVIAPCFFIVEALPDLLPLMIFVGTAALLILTQHQRCQNRWSGAKLSFIMVVPVAALIVLIAAVWPKDTYERPSWPDEMRQNLIYRISTFTARPAASEHEVSNNPDISAAISAVEVYEDDLSKAGPRKYMGVQVMQVKAPDSGMLYLRGTSYAQYSDNVWYSPDPESCPELHFSSISASASGTDIKTLSVRTVLQHTEMFTPYHLFSLPEGSVTVNDSFVFDPELPTEYTLDYCGKTTDDNGLPPAYEQFVSEYYTQVPDELWDALFDVAYAQGLFGMDTAKRPNAVAEYIKDCARYDLNTPSVPEGKDFVMWFLNESETGYCVHFATAACLLLRTVDIPTRYVTGYMAQVMADQWSSVHDYAAHAWVEYYVSGVGWVPLEVTPASNNAVSVVTGSEDSSETSPDLPKENEIEPEVSNEPPVQQEASSPVNSVIGSEGRPTGQTVKSRFPVLPFIACFVLVFPFARRFALLTYRKKRYDRCSVNSKALLIWTRVSKLTNALNQTADKELYELAQKARFSQHTLSIEELLLLEQRYDELQKIASGEKLMKQILYRYVLVLY